MFFGRYDYTIDAKGRLNFPAKFRDAMGESFVVLEWVDNCLFVLRCLRWKSWQKSWRPTS